MRYRVLGPVTAEGDDGPLRLGGPKRCTVLAALLLNANRVVPEDRLINLVWGDQPTNTVRSGLQVHISELRTSLGKEVVLRRPSGYLISIDPNELDLHVFGQTIEQADAHFAAGNLEAAATNLRSALDLWTGPPLGGVGDTLIDVEGPGLEERRIAAVEQFFEVELARGHHAKTISELRQAADEHPFRERLQSQLMVALHRCGRTSEALQTFSNTHRMLVDELGIEPGHQLRETQMRILGGTDHTPGKATPEVPAESVPIGTGHTPPAELPHDARGFTGRTGALASLNTDADGIWVISGPPGIGKTALAVHWAHTVRNRFPDGQFYLNLRGFEPDHEPLSGTAALTQLLRTLGVGEGSMPQTVDEQARLYRSMLADKQVLVVLDNARDAEQVRPLLPSSGTTVVTSRNRLGGLVAHAGARPLSLERLSHTEADSLVRHILGPERAEAEPEAVASLARLCDYLPLALRIAAANISASAHPSLAAGVAELARGNPLDALSIDGAEENAVTTAFAVSYAALTPERRRLFRLLGLLPGPDFTPHAAAALADTTTDQAIKGLKALAAANLLEQHTAGRFRFHELVRLFADQQLRAEESSSSREEAWERLVWLYLTASDARAEHDLAQVARMPRTQGNEIDASRWFTGGDEEASAWVEANMANVIALLPRAADHGPYPAAWYLVDSVGNALHNLERRVEWLEVAPELLESAVRRGARRAQAAIHRDMSLARLLTGQPAECMHHLSEAVRASQESGWRECEAFLTVDIGSGLDWSGHLSQAVEHSRRAVDLFREIDSPLGETLALKTLGWQYGHLGPLESAKEYLEAAVTTAEKHGLSFWRAASLSKLGSVLNDLGHYADAERLVSSAVESFSEFQASRMEALALSTLSSVRCDAGDFDRAHEAAARALELGEQDNLRLIAADAVAAVARVETHLGQFDEAERHYRMAMPTTIHVDYWHAGALEGLAHAQIGLGKYQDAVEGAEQARILAARFGHRMIEVRALTVLTEAYAACGADQAATASAETALEYCREAGYVRGEQEVRRALARIHGSPVR